jgi:hypothetical protein
MKRKALLKRIKISGIFEIGFTPSVGTVAVWPIGPTLTSDLNWTAKCDQNTRLAVVNLVTWAT